MATTIWHACASATYGFEWFTGQNNAGGQTADSGTVLGTNPRSWKMTTGAGGTETNAYVDGVAANAGRRISFWAYFPALPGSGTPFASVATSGGTELVTIGLNSDGSIYIGAAGTGSFGGSSAGAVTVNTWMRFTLSYTITNTTTYSIAAFINGVASGTISNTGTMTSGTTNRLYLKASASGGNNWIVYFDQPYIDDGTNLADVCSAGYTRKQTAKLPAANNTGNFEVNIGANPANRYTNMNERPLSTTNGWRRSLTAQTQENYTLQSSSAGDVDISGSGIVLVARTAWIYCQSFGGVGLGTPGIVDNGSVTGVSFTRNVDVLVTTITDSSSYPSNAAGIGMQSGGTANDTLFYECGTIIVYDEPMSGPFPHFIRRSNELTGGMIGLGF